MLARFRSLWKSLTRREGFESAMRSEFDFHLEERIHHLEQQGIPTQQARRQAQLEFGSLERFREECRQARGLGWFDELGRNLRFAVRTYLRDPVFTLTVLATLGICIGAATAVFSVVDAVLWRPLPYPHPERLASVTEFRGPGRDNRLYSHSGANWEVVRDHAEGIQVAVYSGWTKGVNLAAHGRVDFVRQQRVGAGYFRVLGVLPLLGREFSREETEDENSTVTLLSHGLWTSLFGADPGVLGSTVLLKGEPYQVVGIMPSDFVSTYKAELWTPLWASRSGEGAGPNFGIVARLEEGTGWEQAEAGLGALDLDALAGSRPSELKSRLSLNPLQETQIILVRRPLLLILAAVLALLLVGSANLASLMLARSVTRRQEMATRMALGGGRRAVFWQLMVESLVLGLAGGLVGLGLAAPALNSLELLMHQNFELWQSLELDWRLLLAALAASLLTSTIFGMTPALQAARTRLGESLASAGRGTLGSISHWPRRLFIAGEVALVVSLLFVSGLLVRSYAFLAGRSPGFNLEQVLTTQFSLEDSRYQTREQVNRLFEESLDRIRALPGITAAGVALTLPYERALNLGFRLQESRQDRGATVNVVYVTPGLMEALQLSLQEGRLPAAADSAGSTPVLIVNRDFVETFLEGQEALGHWVSVSGAARQIVGVVGSVQAVRPGWGSPEPIGTFPSLFIPSSQLSSGFFQLVHVWFSPSWVVRYQGAAPAVVAGIRGVFQEVDPLLPPAAVRSPGEIQREALLQERFQAWFLAGLALTSLLLAAIGLYGLIAGSVTERTEELGIRLALGASPSQAIRSVALPGLLLTLFGLAVGAGLCLVLGPLVKHLVWGVEATDPMSLLAASACLLAVTGLATLIPALRVVRLSPAQTLRGN